MTTESQNRLRPVIGLVIVALLSGCTQHKPVQVTTDCQPLLNFIGSLQAGEVKKVELETCWMCGDPLGWKRCESFGDPAGQAYCQHQLKHASIEFAQDNLSATLKCLLGASYQPFSGAMVRYHDVSFYTSVPTESGSSVMVTVRFNDGAEEVSLLTTEAGYSDDGDDDE